MKHLIIGIAVLSNILFLTGCKEENKTVDPDLAFETEYIVKNATDIPVEITFYDFEINGGGISRLLLPANDSYFEKLGRSTSYIMTSPDLDKYGLQSAIGVIMNEKAHFVFADGKELWHKCQTLGPYTVQEGIFDINNTWTEVKMDARHYIHTYTIDETLYEQATVMAEE